MTAGRDRPLLRVPPFPGIGAIELAEGNAAEPIDLEETHLDRLFAAICHGQVGGCFWAQPFAGRPPALVVRANNETEGETWLSALGTADREAAVSVLPADDVDPWSLLRPEARLLAHGDDEWAALGHLAGCEVRLLSPGRFGTAGVPTRAAVAAALGTPRYRDPFTGEDIAIEAAIEQLVEWRRVIDANRPIVAACGMAWWKRREMMRFLWAPGRLLRFFRSERRALAYAAGLGGAVAVWPSRMSATMPRAAEAAGVQLVRVEDGFVRSVGLGSDLVPPSSVAVDRLGIHYDPSGPSDLEAILAGATFPPELLARAERLSGSILAAGISKYGTNDAHVFPARQPGRRLVLVTGQVEDDMSVRKGGGGLASNLELLRRVRGLELEAEIWFRPHPDVDAGHRKGTVRDADALRYADRIVRGGGMARLLDLVDGIHVLTSLAGFEALLRGRDVTCHGTPFYSGWGLTRDLAPVPQRRGRKRALQELVAAVLILYPRYLDPVTGLPCTPEVLVRRMGDRTVPNRLGWITGIRRLQGKVLRRKA